MYHDRKYLENTFQEGLFLHQIPYLFSETNIYKGALMEVPCWSSQSRSSHLADKCY